MLVLSCSNITKTYVIDTILDSLSFTVEDGDKIGVIGLKWFRQNYFFNILSGEIQQDSGDIYIQKRI